MSKLRLLLVFLFLFVAGVVSAQGFDVVIAGGRAVDPETGLEAVRNLGIADGRSSAFRIAL